MVVKQRSVPRSSSYPIINTNVQNEKVPPPNSYCQFDRSSSCGSVDTEGQWSTLPTVFESPRRNISFTRNLLSSVPTLTKISFFLALCYAIYSVRTEVTTRKGDIETISRDLDMLKNVLTKDEAVLNSERTLLFKAENKYARLLPEWKDKTMKEGDFNVETIYNQVSRRESAMQDRTNVLQSKIADLHRAEALEHYGDQEYRVKFNLVIDGERHSFVVEMAPLELMPHSVNYFMKMVDAKVWDGTIFSHLLEHILAVEMRDSEGHDKGELFDEKGIGTMAYPEHSEDYPHHKYTLGFSRQPLGPRFFINTQDNSKFHGPGGQLIHHDFDNDGDPCFAQVIEGQNIIDFLRERSVAAKTNGVSHEIYTLIESIRIIQ